MYVVHIDLWLTASHVFRGESGGHGGRDLSQDYFDFSTAGWRFAFAQSYRYADTLLGRLMSLRRCYCAVSAWTWLWQTKAISQTFVKPYRCPDFFLLSSIHYDASQQ